MQGGRHRGGQIHSVKHTYATYVLGPINLAAGGHTITFVGVDRAGADYTALLRQASILQIG